MWVSDPAAYDMVLAVCETSLFVVEYQILVGSTIS